MFGTIGFVGLIACCALLPNVAFAAKLFCYVDSPDLSSTIPVAGRYTFANIPSNVCDLIVYRAGLTPSLTGNVVFDDQNNSFGKFKAGGAAGADLMISVGNRFAVDQTVFGTVLADDALRATFVWDIIALMDAYQLSGVEIDWVTSSSSQNNLSLFLIELRSELLATHIISLAVQNKVNGYADYDLNPYINYFSVRTFDYDVGTAVTQLGSAYTRQQADVNLLIAQGVAANRVILNLPVHAATFQLANAAAHGVGAAAVGPLAAGPYTNEPGLLSWNELSSYISTRTPTPTFATSDSTPYLYSNTDWISYENSASVQNKCLQTRLAGINLGLQSISQDLNNNDATTNSLTRACYKGITCLYTSIQLLGLSVSVCL